MKIDDVIAEEDRKWRLKSFDELQALRSEPHVYFVEHGPSKYQVEVFTKTGKTENEIIVTIECSKDSLLGPMFFGRATFFARGRETGIREIEGNEAW